jgi:hypothetical protein
MSDTPSTKDHATAPSGSHFEDAPLREEARPQDDTGKSARCLPDCPFFEREEPETRVMAYWAADLIISYVEQLLDEEDE